MKYGEWVPVNQALPQGERIWVIITTSWGEVAPDLYYKEFENYNDSVIAWMAMPEGYKIKED